MATCGRVGGWSDLTHPRSKGEAAQSRLGGQQGGGGERRPGRVSPAAVTLLPQDPAAEGGDGPGVWEVGGLKCRKLWVPQAGPRDTCRVWAQGLPSARDHVLRVHSELVLPAVNPAAPDNTHTQVGFISFLWDSSTPSLHPDSLGQAALLRWALPPLCCLLAPQHPQSTPPTQHEALLCTHSTAGFDPRAAVCKQVCPTSNTS
ncbi:uncharacterized protein LOC130679899 [Manis pentadactyla]|uniref:uncharacterized protein LOC130679899 n=1 Tax=Manis pentadactyla TaxID=143292 RepID=UPI00255CD5F4|nr:uncharacterized protein LOC130679899 [Manis pentadactyla]